ncbi:MAG TPA: mannose-1-phosphate guanylyltransferase/mannose-6-phosphate isomerase [Casimicrobiaceae bacterium]|nr:mannose-1-phosphate guanylyltransferase/mannose-6-phosphate isomerase [Casimicrobiaceae bacterium]
MALVPIILSGGAGTRLWPLSREAEPKPFMQLPDGSARSDTLLARTFVRAVALPEVEGLITVTNRDYYFGTRDAYASAGAAPPRVVYLLEPFGRNTAAAVALAALYAEAMFAPDTTLLVLPADHLVRDAAAFASAVSRAATLARDGWLVTFGIAPTTPETGYGYLEAGDALAVADTFQARRFIEKPVLADAQRYLAGGRHLWNSGMFCFGAASVLAAFERHAPALLGAVRPVWHALRAQASGTMLEIDAALFAAVPEISFDVAVMERAEKVAVVRGGFDWSDVGSWRAVADLAAPDADGNRGNGERVSIATRDTYVHAADRVVATVGVEGLFVVETPDAVLIAHRDHLQRVKEVVGELKARGHDAYRVHKTVLRPWGAYTVLQEGPGFKIKRIEVKPGAALSLQLHNRRSEHWVVVGGEARVTNGDRSYSLGPNESTFIPVKTRHRLENSGTVPLLLIEVQCGEYVGEDDIVRFDDRYGRVAK